MSSELSGWTVVSLLAVAVTLVAVLGGTGIAAGDGTPAEDEPSFVVELDSNGDATIVLTITYDLENDDERQAFQTIENDSQSQDSFADRFQSRLQTVATNASEGARREMTVTDASITVTTSDDDSVGIVRLSAAWTNLAAVQDGALVVTEPFASGFTPDRPFTLVAPDGYELTSVTPQAATNQGNQATWNGGTSLGGFEAIAASTGSSGSDGGGNAESGGDSGGSSGGSSGSMPGFGVVVWLASLLVATVLLVRRA